MKVAKRKIFKCGILFCILLIFGVMSQLVCSRIQNVEMKREQNDWKKIVKLQALFENALDDQDVKDYVQSAIGDKNERRFIIGTNKKITFDNLKQKDEFFYNQLQEYGLDGQDFESISINKNIGKYLYVYINRDMQVTVKMADENGKVYSFICMDRDIQS